MPIKQTILSLDQPLGPGLHKTQDIIDQITEAADQTSYAVPDKPAAVLRRKTGVGIVIPDEGKYVGATASLRHFPGMHAETSTNADKSAIDPQRQAIVKELWSRRDKLDPQRRAVVEELAKRIGLSDQPESQQPKPVSYLERAKQAVAGLLPSGRTAAQVGGAMIGGAAGLPFGPAGVATGGVFGGAGGEAAYQLGEHLLSPSTAPKSGAEAAEREATAALGGGLQEAGGGPVAGRIASAAEKRIPKAVTEAIGPATMREKQAIREVASDLAEDFPIALREGKLFEKIGQRLKGYTTQLEQAWSGLPKTTQIPTAPARIMLQQERAKLFNENGTLVKGAESLEREITSLVKYLEKNPSLSAKDFRNNRQLWDRFVEWNQIPRVGGSTEPASDQAYRIAANGFRQMINRTFPNIAKLNKKVGAYLDAYNTMDRADVAGQGKKLETYVRRLFPEAVGVTAGGAVGRYLGGPEGAAIGASIGTGIVGIRQLMNTTAWQTASIPVKRQITRLMNAGSTKRAIGLLLGQIPSASRSEFLKSLSSSPTESQKP